MRGTPQMFSIRSPRETPAVLESGMRSVRSWRKPITSAVDLFPPKLVMRQRLPSGSVRSAASSVMPVTACTCPTIANGIDASTASSWLSR